MKKYEYVIWDFNGTILDDVEASMSSVNKLLVERGLSPMPDFDFYREVFDFPIKNIMPHSALTLSTSRMRSSHRFGWSCITRR